MYEGSNWNISALTPVSRPFWFHADELWGHWQHWTLAFIDIIELWPSCLKPTSPYNDPLQDKAQLLTLHCPKNLSIPEMKIENNSSLTSFSFELWPICLISQPYNYLIYHFNINSDYHREFFPSLAGFLAFLLVKNV